ncbi:hypothetical protein J4Q44_G00169830 [Coregonus suidteri]|uniref:U1 small nuclear ribonucleoprotein 70 kDa n=1 Tax=Coregonus suidteri TaxID=861788 RepID=A0AAN8LKU7_9TELE
MLHTTSPAPAAYKHADGKKIDGRRVLVDVERGRTVKGWQPRRLGGGLGGTRRGGADVNIKHSGRDDASRYDDHPPIGGERERERGPEPRGERRERSERSREHERGGEKERGGERRRSRSRERRRRSSRSRERERGDRGLGLAGPGEESVGGGRRRDRERERGGGGPGGDSRSRERSRDKGERKRRSRSRERKRDRERGKGGEGDEGMGLGEGMMAEGGERMPEEPSVGEEGGEVGEERGGRERDRERERDRRRSHRDKDRDRDRERHREKDREHKRDRERGGGERREDRHGSLLLPSAEQDDVGNGEEGEAPPKPEENSQDGLMDQESVQSGEGYVSNENGYKMATQADEY